MSSDNIQIDALHIFTNDSSKMSDIELSQILKDMDETEEKRKKLDRETDRALSNLNEIQHHSKVLLLQLSTTTTATMTTSSIGLNAPIIVKPTNVSANKMIASSFDDVTSTNHKPSNINTSNLNLACGNLIYVPDTGNNSFSIPATYTLPPPPPFCSASNNNTNHHSCTIPYYLNRLCLFSPQQENPNPSPPNPVSVPPFPPQNISTDFNKLPEPDPSTALDSSGTSCTTSIIISQSQQQQRAPLTIPVSSYISYSTSASYATSGTAVNSQLFSDKNNSMANDEATTIKPDPGHISFTLTPNNNNPTIPFSPSSPSTLVVVKRDFETRSALSSALPSALKMMTSFTGFPVSNLSLKVGDFLYQLATSAPAPSTTTETLDSEITYLFVERVSDGSRGYIPASYVEQVPKHLLTDYFKLCNLIHLNNLTTTNNSCSGLIYYNDDYYPYHSTGNTEIRYTIAPTFYESLSSAFTLLPDDNYNKNFPEAQSPPKDIIRSTTTNNENLKSGRSRANSWRNQHRSFSVDAPGPTCCDAPFQANIDYSNTNTNAAATQLFPQRLHSRSSRTINSENGGMDAYDDYLIESLAQQQISLGPDASIIVPHPQSLVVEKRLKKSLLVSWCKPSELPVNAVRGYQVVMDGSVKCATEKEQRSRALIEDIDFYKTHRISIRAITPVGYSHDAFCSMTIGRDANFAPTRITAIDITKNSALIIWLASDTNISHTVFVNDILVKTVKPGTLKYHLKGLSPSTNYKVKVKTQVLATRSLSRKPLSETFNNNYYYRYGTNSTFPNRRPASALDRFTTDNYYNSTLLLRDENEFDKGKQQPLFEYDYRHYLSNTSSTSITIEFKTLPGKIPKPPTDVVIEPGPQDGSFLLSWNPVAPQTESDILKESSMNLTTSVHEYGIQNGKEMASYVIPSCLDIKENSCDDSIEESAKIDGYRVYFDGKRVANISSPSGDHIILNMETFLLNEIPTFITVRSFYGELLSVDSLPARFLERPEPENIHDKKDRAQNRDGNVDDEISFDSTQLLFQNFLPTITTTAFDSKLKLFDFTSSFIHQGRPSPGPGGGSGKSLEGESDTQSGMYEKYLKQKFLKDYIGHDKQQYHDNINNYQSFPKDISGTIDYSPSINATTPYNITPLPFNGRRRQETTGKSSRGPPYQYPRQLFYDKNGPYDPLSHQEFRGGKSSNFDDQYLPPLYRRQNHRRGSGSEIPLNFKSPYYEEECLFRGKKPENGYRMTQQQPPPPLRRRSSLAHLPLAPTSGPTRLYGQRHWLGRPPHPQKYDQNGSEKWQDRSSALPHDFYKYGKVYRSQQITTPRTFVQDYKNINQPGFTSFEPSARRIDMDNNQRRFYTLQHKDHEYFNEQQPGRKKLTGSVPPLPYYDYEQSRPDYNHRGNYSAELAATTNLDTNGTAAEDVRYYNTRIPAPTHQQQQQQPSTPSNRNMVMNGVGAVWVRALFSYDPKTMSPNDPEAAKEELPFQIGQLIRVLSALDQDGFFWGSLTPDFPPSLSGIDSGGSGIPFSIRDMKKDGPYNRYLGNVVGMVPINMVSSPLSDEEIRNCDLRRQVGGQGSKLEDRYFTVTPGSTRSNVIIPSEDDRISYYYLPDDKRQQIYPPPQLHNNGTIINEKLFSEPASSFESVDTPERLKYQQRLQQQQLQQRNQHQTKPLTSRDQQALNKPDLNVSMTTTPKKVGNRPDDDLSVRSSNGANKHQHSPAILDDSKNVSNFRQKPLAKSFRETKSNTSKIMKGMTHDFNNREGGRLSPPFKQPQHQHTFVTKGKVIPSSSKSLSSSPPAPPQSSASPYDVYGVKSSQGRDPQFNKITSIPSLQSSASILNNGAITTKSNRIAATHNDKISRQEIDLQTAGNAAKKVSSGTTPINGGRREYRHASIQEDILRENIKKDEYSVSEAEKSLRGDVIEKQQTASKSISNISPASLGNDVSSSKTSSSKMYNGLTGIKLPPNGKRMIALYDYDPKVLSPNVDSDLELAFTTGDIVIVEGEMDADGFYVGFTMDGHRGFVPSNFLKELPPLPEDDPDFQKMMKQKNRFHSSQNLSSRRS